MQKRLAWCFQKGREQDGPKKEKDRLTSGTHLSMFWDGSKILSIVLAYMGACPAELPQVEKKNTFEAAARQPLAGW